MKVAKRNGARAHKAGNPYKHHYKYGKQTKPIDFETFKETMETTHFDKNSHKSFFAFLYWFGLRKSEAIERVKEDFNIKDEFMVVNAPSKRHENRSPLLQARLDFPFMDLIVSQVKKAKKGHRVWSFSKPTAWRIVKRVLGKEYYPDHLRLGIETRESDYLLYAQTKRLEQAKRIVKALRASYLLFEVKKKAHLFRKDISSLIPELYTPCRDDTHFLAKIVNLYNLFDVPLAPLRRLVKKPEKRGAISLVEKWLQDKRLDYDKDMIETWKNIVILRNAEPIHPDTDKEELWQALSFFGMRYPLTYSSDYSRLWDAILEKFVTSIEAWQRILENL